MNSFFFKIIVFFFQILPFGLVYFISSVLYLLIYKVFRYRYTIVADNLQKAFPSLNPLQKKRLIKAFYQHLCDLTLESLKGLGIKKEEIQQRYQFINPALLNTEFEKGQSIIILGSHYGNWEWGVLSVSLWLKHQVVGIYKPIKNKAIGDLFNQNRKKWGLTLAPMAKTGRALIQKREKPAAFVFIADQSPSDVKNAHWLNFFNQKTAFHHGVDKIARRTNYPVYLFDIQRVKRGYYQVHFSLLCADPKSTANGEITSLYAKALEGTIKQQPAYWLWSHRRWKRSFSTKH